MISPAVFIARAWSGDQSRNLLADAAIRVHADDLARCLHRKSLVGRPEPKPLPSTEHHVEVVVEVMVKPRRSAFPAAAHPESDRRWYEIAHQFGDHGSMSASQQLGRRRCTQVRPFVLQVLFHILRGQVEVLGTCLEPIEKLPKGHSFALPVSEETPTVRGTHLNLDRL